MTPTPDTMDNEKTGGPAYPAPIDDVRDMPAFQDAGMLGMTLLDHFAGLAMAKLMDEWGMWKPNTPDAQRKRKVPIMDDGYPVTLASMGEEDIDCLCRYAYQFASAMIDERNRLMNQ